MSSSRDFVKYWLPVILFACFIFWMSTETFSSENTFSVVRAIIKFLVPTQYGTGRETTEYIELVMNP